MFHKLRLLSNRENLKVVYKILHDILFIVLIFFLLALIAEGLIPGIITTHIGFSRVVTFIFVNLVAIYALGNFLHINLKNNKITKKTALPVLLILILLIFNSLLSISIYLNIFIILLTIVSGYFVYQVILEEKN